MKTNCITLATVFYTALTALAAEPLAWVRKPNQPTPAQFDVFHGESLDFRCTFTGFGALPFAGDDAPRLYYQTNGMGAAWWSLPATVSSNMLAATFPPGADPGAERLSVFFGAPSNAYAAAQVRFRNSPGATPNHLTPPTILDWQSSLASATNDLHESLATKIADIISGDQSVGYAAEAELAIDARYADYAYVSDRLGDPSINRDAETIFAQLDAASHITTNDVYAIVTNEVHTGEWTYEGLPEGAVITFPPRYIQEQGYPWEIAFNVGSTSYVGNNLTYDAKLNPVRFYCWDQGEESTNFIVTATRQNRNALGLARMSDITNTVTKAYVEGLGIEAGTSASTATNIAESVVNATVTGVVRAVSFKVKDYIFDPVTEVCWRRQMVNGFLDYIAVTNIDVTLPENYEALEALERRDNQ